MSKYPPQKRSCSFVSGNACPQSDGGGNRAPLMLTMAIDAFSAGLAPIGFCHRVDQAKTLIRKTGCWVEGPGVYEHLAQSLGAGRHRQSNMSGPLPGKWHFDDYSRVRGLGISRIPMVRIPGTHQRGLRGNSTGVLQNWAQELQGNNWLQEIRGKRTLPVRFTGTPWAPADESAPSSTHLNRPWTGEIMPSVLNISEDGLGPCQQPQILSIPSSSEYAGRVSLGSSHPLDRSAWPDRLEKQF